MSIFQIILILFTAHFILDFPLQGEFLANFKSQKNYVLFVHCFIWAGGLSVVLMYLGMFAWWKFAMLLVLHLFVDAWKCRGHYKVLNISDWNSLYIDQSIHIIQILFCLLPCSIIK